jgi:hypothetical protein
MIFFCIVEHVINRSRIIYPWIFTRVLEHISKTWEKKSISLNISIHNSLEAIHKVSKHFH